MYVLPRLPADNKTYMLVLESTLSKSSHVYEEQMLVFNSDGHFKHFTIDFVPKVSVGFVIVVLIGFLFYSVAL